MPLEKQMDKNLNNQTAKILIGNTDPESKDAFVRNGRRVVNNLKWLSSRLPSLNIYAVSGGNDLDVIVNALDNAKLQKHNFAVIPPAQLAQINHADAYIVASAIHDASAKAFLQKTSAPVFQYAPPEQIQPGYVPLPATDPTFILKEITKAKDLAPVFVVSREKVHAERFASMLDDWGTYFKLHPRDCSEIKSESKSHLQRGVVLYLDNPGGKDTDPADPMVKELLEPQNKFPVIYLRPQHQYWRAYSLEELFKMGLFDYYGSFFAKFLTGQNPDLEEKRKMDVGLERITNAVHSAFMSQNAYGKNRMEAFEFARTQMPFILIHAAREKSVKYMTKIQKSREIRLSANTFHTHIGRDYQQIYTDEALEEAKKVAKLWRPNMVIIDVVPGASIDEKGNKRTLKNEHALLELRKELPDSVFILGYDGGNSEMRELLKSMARRDTLLIPERFPLEEEFHELLLRAWDKHLEQLNKKNAKLNLQKKLEHLRTLRSILKTEPRSLEEKLSPKFAFNVFNESKEPKVQYQGKPIYPGASSGRVYADLREAVNAIENKQNVLMYLEDLSSLALSDIKLIRSYSDRIGILFKYATYENHNTIDLQRSGIPMIKINSFKKEEPGKVAGFLFGSKAVYSIDNFTFAEDEEISFNGSNGRIYAGKQKILPSDVNADDLNKKNLTEAVKEYLSLIQKGNTVLKHMNLKVMINADSEEEIREARKWGRDDIGVSLVRTENIIKNDKGHVYAYGDLFLALCSLYKLKEDEAEVRKVGPDFYNERLAANSALVDRAQREFERMQEKKFYTLLKYQTGRRIQVRLLDPPMSAFFGTNDVDAISNRMQGHYEFGKNVFIDAINEGLRGAQLLRWKEIYQSQIKALFMAYYKIKKEEVNPPDLRIFIPYVEQFGQVKLVKDMMHEINQKDYEGKLQELVDNHGVTLETPTGCGNAGAMIRQLATKNFAFGTNDLFPYLEARADRDKKGFSYHETAPDGTPLLSDGIIGFLRSTLDQLDQAETERKKSNARFEYDVGLCGELNQVKLHPRNMGQILRRVDYISASKPKQIPVLKLIVAQNYLRSKGIDKDVA